MALKLVLKPGERIFMGTSSMLVVSNTYVTLAIEGTIPVVREGDLIGIGDDSTITERFAFQVQEQYMSGSEAARRKLRDLLPELPEPIQGKAVHIVKQVEEGRHYQALKAARDLIRQVGER